MIIPAFNAAATIDEALASVAEQTVTAAEVVVCDDRSGDGTAGVARAWADRLPLRVIELADNVGAAGARAHAIAATTSARLALLDADDVWFPDHLATMGALHQGDDTLVTADPECWVPGEDIATRWSSQFRVPAGDGLRALYRANYIHSSTLFSRTLHDRAGGFREPIRFVEDWDLWLRMLRAGARVVMAGHPTLRYRIRAPGDGAFANRLLVLAWAAQEAVSPSERRAARAATTHVRAEQHLFEAYGVAEADPWRARWLGAAATRGQRRVALRGAAMVVAPRWVTARRRDAHRDPRAWLRG